MLRHSEVFELSHFLIVLLMFLCARKGGYSKLETQHRGVFSLNSIYYELLELPLDKPTSYLVGFGFS